jgi:hypothetical protein
MGWLEVSGWSHFMGMGDWDEGDGLVQGLRMDSILRCCLTGMGLMD